MTRNSVGSLTPYLNKTPETGKSLREMALMPDGRPGVVRGEKFLNTGMRSGVDSGENGLLRIDGEGRDAAHGHVGGKEQRGSIRAELRDGATGRDTGWRCIVGIE
jgi:hypothetical protein